MPRQMPVQVAIGPKKHKIDVAKLLRVCPTIKNGNGSNKPSCVDGNLLWTSPLDEEYLTSDWLDWCSTSAPKFIGDQAAILNVLPSANILHISDEGQFIEAYYKFPREFRSEDQGYGKTLYLDFEAMAKQYDAIHVYGRGLAVKDLYGWDVDSTAWFNPKVLELDRIVDIEKRCSYPADVVVEELEDYEKRRYERYKLKMSAFVRYQGRLYRKVR